jgi:hypothetical protein
MKIHKNSLVQRNLRAYIRVFLFNDQEQKQEVDEFSTQTNYTQILHIMIF